MSGPFEAVDYGGAAVVAVMILGAGILLGSSYESCRTSSIRGVCERTGASYSCRSVEATGPEGRQETLENCVCVDAGAVMP
jgi:hypothetical protein